MLLTEYLGIVRPIISFLPYGNMYNQDGALPAVLVFLFYSASAGAKMRRVLSAEKIRDFGFFFVDQATPGFELGKKDLQSPALPLGHVAKLI